ncbi:hypothetical protein M885DRAFT_507329 [Pelagophyceae sp. CCMP2097]|nr:hypothetical protein M885DRAFT_507329 [Pelagophyceae sp. CCMP2097]
MAGAACEQRHVFSATAVSLRLADDELKFTWRSRLSKQAHVGSFNVSAVETAEPKGAKGLRFGGAGNLTLFDGAFESPEVRDSWATAVSELLQRSRRRILREDAANAVLEQAAHSSAAAALASAEAAAESQEAATLKRLSQEAAHERRKERSDSLRKKYDDVATRSTSPGKAQ